MDKSAPKTVLITGATSGIGLALARRFARESYNLIIVARSESELQTVKAALELEFKIMVTTMVKDLSKEGAAAEVYDTIHHSDTIVDVLVNNAGYAEYGLFHDIPLANELSLVQLNLVTMTTLLKLFSDEMIARKSGKILNVGSTAAFMPGGPLMSVYYATKAFMLSLTEAMAKELHGTGVAISILCPGATKTRFQDTAKINDTLIIRMGMMSAETVADVGYRGLMSGKTIIVPGILNKAMVQVLRISPRKLVRAIILKMQTRPKGK